MCPHPIFFLAVSENIPAFNDFKKYLPPFPCFSLSFCVALRFKKTNFKEMLMAGMSWSIF